jgi:ADP-ribose pyrophosphatase YjhB (NUDIX family)
MVRHEREDRVFWTLPGGGVEAGETLEEAVVREVAEEVCLYTAKAERLLFETEYSLGPDYCFLVTVDGSEVAQLGMDPELQPEEQVIKQIAWFTLEEKKNDHHVSKVIPCL